MICLIPARGGSKGLGGKNIRGLRGFPLIAHSILYAQSLPDIEQVYVSTDSGQIGDIATQYGAEVIKRPYRLARDNSPIWPVVQHAWKEISEEHDYLLMLEAPSPIREIEDYTGAMALLEKRTGMDGVVTMAKPFYEPWAVVVEEPGGLLKPLLPNQDKIYQRQQNRPCYRYSGMYIWRKEFIETHMEQTWQGGKHIGFQTPSIRCWSIDTIEEFVIVDGLMRLGILRLPWVKEWVKDDRRNL